MGDALKRMVEQLDTELVAVQDTAYGGFWPATALAIALIDAGVIERKKLLEIIDDLHSLAEADAEPGRGEDAALPLELMRRVLDHWPLERGKAAQALRALADTKGSDILHRALQRRRKR